MVLHTVPRFFPVTTQPRSTRTVTPAHVTGCTVVTVYRSLRLRSFTVTLVPGYGSHLWLYYPTPRAGYLRVAGTFARLRLCVTRLHAHGWLVQLVIAAFSGYGWLPCLPHGWLFTHGHTLYLVHCRYGFTLYRTFWLHTPRRTLHGSTTHLGCSTHGWLYTVPTVGYLRLVPLTPAHATVRIAFAPVLVFVFAGYNGWVYRLHPVRLLPLQHLPRSRTVTLPVMVHTVYVQLYDATRCTAFLHTHIRLPRTRLHIRTRLPRCGCTVTLPHAHALHSYGYTGYLPGLPRVGCRLDYTRFGLPRWFPGAPGYAVVHHSCISHGYRTVTHTRGYTHTAVHGYTVTGSLLPVRTLPHRLRLRGLHLVADCSRLCG